MTTIGAEYEQTEAEQNCRTKQRRIAEKRRNGKH
jgi:hypothetical protein